MPTSRRVRPGTAIGIALVAALVSAAAGCLFGGRGRGSLDQLVVLQYRWNPDEEHDKARVFGRIKNTGDRPVPPAEVVATLRSRSGEMRGENRKPIPSLESGETHDFSLEVTMHGSAAEVEIRIVEPGQAPPEPKEES